MADPLNSQARLIAELRARLKVSSDVISDDELLEATRRSFSRAKAEASLAMEDFGEAVKRALPTFLRSLFG